jgi:hypothetical protein
VDRHSLGRRGADQAPQERFLAAETKDTEMNHTSEEA